MNYLIILIIFKVCRLFSNSEYVVVLEYAGKSGRIISSAPSLMY
jgi:hypothetical protein